MYRCMVNKVTKVESESSRNAFLVLSQRATALSDRKMDTHELEAHGLLQISGWQDLSGSELHKDELSLVLPGSSLNCKNNKQKGDTMTSATECSNVAETSESTLPQSCPGWPPAEPPSREHGWPPVAPPPPIARAMEFCRQNCRIAQRTEQSIDSPSSDQRRCKFPQHCAIQSPHVDTP
jgi:hypothetical protein